eukprot:scaffold28676_cov90-Isochrysis_galbana.AAC.1
MPTQPNQYPIRPREPLSPLPPFSGMPRSFRRLRVHRCGQLSCTPRAKGCGGMPRGVKGCQGV